MLAKSVWERFENIGHDSVPGRVLRNKEYKGEYISWFYCDALEMCNTLPTPNVQSRIITIHTNINKAQLAEHLRTQEAEARRSLAGIIFDSFDPVLLSRLIPN